MCEHKNFHANVAVNRLEDTKQFVADVSIKCEDCGAEFEFLGLSPGLNLQGATISLNGLEARLAICPKGMRPNPIHGMSFGIDRFDS